MFYDVRVITKKAGRTIVIVRKVFPKKRKRNQIAGLERNYVATKKKYVVEDTFQRYIPSTGRLNLLFEDKRVKTLKLRKGDRLKITSTGSWEITRHN